MWRCYILYSVHWERVVVGQVRGGRNARERREEFFLLNVNIMAPGSPEMGGLGANLESHSPSTKMQKMQLQQKGFLCKAALFTVQPSLTRRDPKYRLLQLILLSSWWGVLAKKS